MKTFRFAAVFLLVLGEPSFSTPFQVGQCKEPEPTVTRFVASQPACRLLQQNSPCTWFVAALSEASLMSRATVPYEAKPIALMCTSRAPSAICREVKE